MSLLLAQIHFARIRATGRDRAKFLHNFCTNQIKELPAGTACEAFFTDVKGRVLAHGFVLALENSHEIWMLPGDPEALLKHLSRYVITEDVEFKLLASSNLCFSIATDKAAAALRQELPGLTDGTMSCLSHVSGVIAFRFEWNQTSIVAVAGDDAKMTHLRALLHGQSVELLTSDEFNRLRITSRFPIIGRDMTNDNLAPEAERNSSAISYTKGCYLGQEPIARLDAMGHVNRALRTVHVAASPAAVQMEGRQIVTPDGAAAGTITSAMALSSTELCGLAMLRVAAIPKTLQIVLDSGETLAVQVLPTE